MVLILQTALVWEGLYQDTYSSELHTYCCLLAKSCPVLLRPQTVAHQATLSMGFPRQEYWSGLSFPSPGIEPASPPRQADPSPLCRQSLQPTGEPTYLLG